MYELLFLEHQDQTRSKPIYLLASLFGKIALRMKYVKEGMTRWIIWYEQCFQAGDCVWRVEERERRWLAATRPPHKVSCDKVSGRMVASLMSIRFK